MARWHASALIPNICYTFCVVRKMGKKRNLVVASFDTHSFCFGVSFSVSFFQKKVMTISKQNKATQNKKGQKTFSLRKVFLSGFL
jgi:hypothetical protein